MKIREVIVKIPIIGRIASLIYRGLYRRFHRFSSSQIYWEQRYAQGGNSGAGSYGRLAEFKADVINSFIRENGIKSVIEFGCGDGFQISLANYPEYTGLDVSPTVIKLCRERFAGDISKKFFLFEPKSPSANKDWEPADLALSLDVVYHLTEDEVFEEHMKVLFDAAKKYVIIYSSNYDESQSYHVKHREFTKWVNQNATDWQLAQKIDNIYRYNTSNTKNTSWSDFYIFKKVRPY
jgi:SAM-dependent methyltransferase